MAKKPGKSKKSRFGNPAKAASDNKVLSFTDAAAHRSVEKLLPAFHDWLGRAGVDPEERERLSSLLMNFFRNYSASVGVPDATALDVDLATQILADAGRFHPEMRVAVSTALGGYLKFLSSMQLWTGPTADLQQLVALADQGVFEPPARELADYVHHEGMAQAAAGVDRAGRQYVSWAVALLRWIGDGRELTATGMLRRKDIAEAAACVEANAVGSARLELPSSDPDAVRAVTSMAHVPRLMQYWRALIDIKLVKVSGKKIELTKAGKAFLAAPALAPQKTAELAYCLFHDEIVPYDDFVHPRSTVVAVGRLLAVAASARPDLPIPFEHDESIHTLHDSRWWALAIDRSIKNLTTAGLVEEGPDTTVPPSLRSALAPVLESLDKVIAASPTDG